jgi:hypothetical protein
MKLFLVGSATDRRRRLAGDCSSARRSQTGIAAATILDRTRSIRRHVGHLPPGEPGRRGRGRSTKAYRRSDSRAIVEWAAAAVGSSSPGYRLVDGSRLLCGGSARSRASSALDRGLGCSMPDARARPLGRVHTIRLLCPNGRFVYASSAAGYDVDGREGAMAGVGHCPRRLPARSWSSTVRSARGNGSASRQRPSPRPGSWPFGRYLVIASNKPASASMRSWAGP